VKLAKHVETGEVVALKIMKEMSVDLELVRNEISILQDLNHPNIVNLIGWSEEAILAQPDGQEIPVMYIALELATNGDLCDLIILTGRFIEDHARYYFHQMLEGLDHLHSQGISHRDLKPDNMMLDDEFDLKLADFGFSSNQALNETRRGTGGYMAPEIYTGLEYSGPCIDLFAMGVILFSMVAGNPPFRESSLSDPHYNLIRSNRIDTFWHVHSRNREGGLDFFSEDFRHLINGLLSLNPHERPSLAEIREHPWYTATIPTKEEMFEELEKRRQQIEESNNQSEEEVPDTSEGQTLYTHHQVQRSPSNPEEEKKETSIKRRLVEFTKEVAKYTRFYSTYTESELCNTIA